MPDDPVTPEGGAPADAGDSAEETYTLTRAQMDEFRQRTIDEHTKQQAPAAPKTSPLDAYYAGVQSRAAQKQARQPAAPQAESSLDRLAKIMELQIMSTMAPKPPPPPKPMTAREKLSSGDPTVWMGRTNANAWSADDRAALIAEHADALRKTGYKGDVDAEARARAAREVTETARKVAGDVRITVGPTGFTK